MNTLFDKIIKRHFPALPTDPFEPSAISEAVGEMPEMVQQAAATALRSGDFVLYGQIHARWIEGYWDQQDDQERQRRARQSIADYESDQHAGRAA